MCDLAWFTDVLDKNPEERAKRDAIVAHAETQGGRTLEYIRLLFPRYWFLVEDVPAGTEGQFLQMTEAEEMAVLSALFSAVLPALCADPKGKDQKTKLSFPDKVRHAAHDEVVRLFTKKD
jgi:hypothetical protein